MGSVVWQGTAKERAGGAITRTSRAWVRGDAAVRQRLHGHVDPMSLQDRCVSAQFGRSDVFIPCNPQSAEVTTCRRGSVDDPAERSELLEVT